MKVLKVGALAGLALCGTAGAADFAMMETAEPIVPSSFKLAGGPILIDRDRGDNDGGFGIGVGYGLPYDLDIEGQLALYDDATWAGADIEWNAWTGNSMRFSIGGGLHGGDLERDSTAAGADATAIFTFTPMQRLDVSASLDASYDDVNVRGTPATPVAGRFTADGAYQTYHFAPGVEYQLTRNLDLLGEVGIGLDGDSDDYVSAGMSWYFR